jgi:hypothetical protein
MWIINRTLMAIFDVLYGSLAAMHPLVPLVVISALFGVVALVIVRYCSRQEAIGRIKDQIKANLLSIWLFKDELRVSFWAFLRILWGALRLQANMVPPLLVMLVPMVLICAQMAGWHEWRPLRVGERALLKLTLDSDAPASALDITPQVPPAVTLEHRTRAPAAKEVCWYVRSSQPGRFPITFPVQGQEFTKELVVNDGFERVSPLRHNGGWVDSFIYPCEQPLPEDAPVRSIAVALPSVESCLYGGTWWIVWFLVYSIAVALIVKPYLKVNF